MGILFGPKKPKLTVEERVVQKLNAVVAQADPEEIAQFSDVVGMCVPIILGFVGSVHELPFLRRCKDAILEEGGKLIWHALSPKECIENLLKAAETHGQDIQRIFVEQVARYQRQREKEQHAHTIEATVAPVATKLLEPAQ